MADEARTSVRRVVVPAGGGSRRLGRDKLAVDVEGSTVLDQLLLGLLDALPGVPVIAVGPSRATRTPVTWCREQPAGGGPVAALAAGLTAPSADDDISDGDPAPDDLVAVVAGDLPFGADAVPALVAAATAAGAAAGPGAGPDCWLALDPLGVPQPLLGVYRWAPLLVAIGDEPGGRSLRSVLAGLRVETVAVAGHATTDVDTEDDVAAVRRVAAARTARSRPGS